jgi:hypothetical protein
MADGQGRALSGHRSKAYEGYAKRTMKTGAGSDLKVRCQGSKDSECSADAIQNEGGDDEAALA